MSNIPPLLISIKELSLNKFSLQMRYYHYSIAGVCVSLLMNRNLFIDFYSLIYRICLRLVCENSLKIISRHSTLDIH
jgi:hypothetical protein